MISNYKTALFSLTIFTCISFNCWTQNFERVESIAGLATLSENNGVAVADFDQDGDLDIFIVAKGKDLSGIEKTHSKLYRNDNNGAFTDVTDQTGLSNLFPNSEHSEANPALEGVKYGVSWGDYDNDGYPDLFLTYLFKVQLFHNEGDGTFVDRTVEAGITKQNGCWNTCATWFDFNNDSYLDLFVSDWEKCGANTFYLNNGDGTFENVTEEFGLDIPLKRSYLAFPFDFNNDGWMDIYVANDFQVPNHLWINNNGTSITEQAAAFGLGNEFNDMGITMGDYNKDGLFDLYVTTINSNALFKNNGDNTYTDVASQENIKDVGWAWDTVFTDFDLDGDEDLFIVNGFNISGPQFNRYYKNEFVENGSGFSDVTENINLHDAGESIGSTPFDYDNDGDLDIIVTNNDRESFFYENKIINGTEPSNLNWLKVSLEGTVSNRNAFGTTVTVKTSNEEFKRYYNGLGFLSQSIKPIHFGLGDENDITEITIKWPSGLVESYQDFDSNTRLKFTEGEGYEIINTAPSVKIFGCTDPNSCNFNPNATQNNGTCQYLSTSQISGPIQSGFNQIANYTYYIGDNSSTIWTVQGGELISGQGTNQISVKWHLEESGKITVKEVSDLCQSQETELTVSLNVANAPANVSVARLWNEALLEAIRNDFARPNVHARNLFHTAIALYDSWAIYDLDARPYLINNEVYGFSTSIDEFTPSKSEVESQIEAMSYAAYRLLSYRFQNSPGAENSIKRFNLLMEQLGFDTSFTATDYRTGNAAALGNFIAQTIINYGATDGSNESADYEYSYYEPVNDPLDLSGLSNQTGLTDPNRWQPLQFSSFVDQSGNLIEDSTPRFLGPEWGNVNGFALINEMPSQHQREGNTYNVFYDPGQPPQLNTNAIDTSSELYKWNFSLVSIWSSHLDPEDGVLWDISPNTIGNIDHENFPKDLDDHLHFYNEIQGGDISAGHNVNPATGLPYQIQMVPRADYARVLAEFWADGPDSETPPGHWFTILNYVLDHAQFQRRFKGEGELLSPLEWDVKAYFTLGGAMHDAAISAWSIKGWYDYIRPISAIRYMCELGQSTDEKLSNYHVGGIPLKDGFIEIIEEGDDLAGTNNEHVGKIKLYTWRGHNSIINSDTDVAGVGWILAEDWWPYQRPSFVTPPFAGYVSGHSTFSRTAAEIMTSLTGDPFFPGGMGEFVAKKDEFLVFEKGPSVDVILQWATYYDASDQTSLSRIWGGIHPPADDIPGRIIGREVGIKAFEYAESFFTSEKKPDEVNQIVYPNPVENYQLHISNSKLSDQYLFFDMLGHSINIEEVIFDDLNLTSTLTLPKHLATGMYILQVNKQSHLILLKE